jgi:hypothetical protein
MEVGGQLLEIIDNLLMQFSGFYVQGPLGEIYPLIMEIGKTLTAVFVVGEIEAYGNCCLKKQSMNQTMSG